MYVSYNFFKSLPLKDPVICTAEQEVKKNPNPPNGIKWVPMEERCSEGEAFAVAW